MENNNMKILFDKFSDKENLISYTDMKRIINILKLDINKLKKKDDYTFDDMILQIEYQLGDYDKTIQVTKQSIENKLQGSFDSTTAKFISSKILKNKKKIDPNKITLPPDLFPSD